MRAEPFRLLAHIVHQIRTHDAIGKAWEILHFGGVDQLAAGRQRAVLQMAFKKAFKKVSYPSRCFT